MLGRYSILLSTVTTVLYEIWCWVSTPILFLKATQYKKECMVFPYESTGHLFNVPPCKVAAIWCCGRCKLFLCNVAAELMDTVKQDTCMLHISAKKESWYFMKGNIFAVSKISQQQTCICNKLTVMPARDKTLQNLLWRTWALHIPIHQSDHCE